MIIDVIRIAILLAVTFIYAMLDLFNKRDLPDWFAYVSIGIGLLMTFSYGYGIALESIVIAIAIGSLGYVGYRAGYIGLGDVFEFVFISLVVPLQTIPYLITMPQGSLPFALSVLIAAGFMAGLIMPIYYIDKSRGKKVAAVNPAYGRRRAWMSMITGVMYIILLAIILLIGTAKLVSVVLVSLIAIPSLVILRYGDRISEGMVELVYPKELVDGDMIAIGMMKKNDIAYFKKSAKSFGILADSALISKIKNIRRRIPVYKNAIPLAVFIFAGVIISLLFGNILLLIVFSMLGG
jgi:hypothetical protein